MRAIFELSATNEGKKKENELRSWICFVEYELDFFQRLLKISKTLACFESSNEPVSVKKIIPEFRIWEEKENSVDFRKIVTKTTYFKNRYEEQQVIFFLKAVTLLVPLLPI